MKTWLSISCLLGLGVVATFGQGAQADQIKRRARNVADQNNARQGAPPTQPAPPSATQRPPSSPAASAPVASQLTPGQKRVATIRTDLATLAATNSADTRKRFSRSLLTAAHGGVKPTGSATDRVTEQLATALAGAKLTPAQLDRLAQNLDGVMNSGGMPKPQTDAIADDVKALLAKAGGDTTRSASVADELRRVTAEIQKSTK